MNSKQFLRYGSIFLSILLIIGETLVLLKTNKYWPLSVDDYVAATCIIISAYLAKENKYLPYLIAAWAFVLGNMYAMLFNRLDPVYGSGERINLLIGINFIALFFLIFSFSVYRNSLGAEKLK
jgi:hypothetical protein